MAFCKNCGAQTDDNSKFCVSCGAPATDEATPQQTYQQPPPGQQSPPYYQQQSSYQQQPYAAAPPLTDDARDAADNKVMGILAYLGFLVLIPLLAAKGSKFARFHANQGLVLAIAELVWIVVVAILGAIFLAVSWQLYLIFSAIAWLPYIAFGIFSILGIINAAKGEKKPLPLIGNITILK